MIPNYLAAILIIIFQHASCFAETGLEKTLTDASSHDEQVEETPSSTEPADVPKYDNYSLSAAVARNHERERLVQAILNAIQSKNHTDTAKFITDALAQGDDGFVEYRGVLHRFHPLIRKLIAGLSQQSLPAYRRESAQAAEAAFVEAMQSGDRLALMKVRNQFPNTEVGNRAEELLVAKLRDQGELVHADLFIQNMLEQLPGTQASQTRRQRLVSLQSKLRIATAKVEETRILAQEFRPSAVPLWSTEHEISTDGRQLIKAGQRDLRENGLTPFSPWTAARVGEHLITITPIQLEARNPLTGELVWSRKLPQYSSRILSKVTSADNPLRSWNIARSALFRIFGESLNSSFAVDNKHVYFIEENAAGPAFAPKKKSQRRAANQIVCVAADTGKEKWKNDSLEESRAYLCSPPQLWGPEILLLAEYRHTSQVYLIALDKNSGELTRSLPLANVARPVEKMTTKAKKTPDSRRQGFACPIQVIGSKAYCPTGAGLLAVVDLLDWSTDWVYRYPRHDVQYSGTGILRPKVGMTGYQWWSEWHEVQTVFFGDYVAFASPESKRMTLLDRRSGEALWTTAREDGLYIATAGVAEGVVVIGSDFARAHSVETGQLLWKTPLNFPAGRGVRCGNGYLLPDSEMGWSFLNIQTGEVTNSLVSLSSEFVSYHLPDVSNPRNYVAIEDELYELSYRGLKRLQSVPATAKQIENRSASERLLHQIETGLNAEQLNLAVTGTKETSLGEFSKQLVEQTILKNLSKPTSDGSLQPPIRLNSEDLQLNWFCKLFASALESRDISAIRALMTNHLPTSMMTRFVTSRRLRTRLDRWILSALLYANADYSEIDRLKLAESLRLSMNSRLLDQPTEREIFTDFFAGTPWKFVKSEERQPQTELRDLIKQQLQQAEREARKSVFLSKDNRSKNAWGTNEPTVSAQSRLSANVFFESVPIKNIDGSNNTDLNLEIEFPGHRAVRFSGEHWQRPWPAYLPRSDRTLRLENELVQAWSIGQLIVLQVGSEVYGFSPFTAEGYRGAKLLWPNARESIDTLGDRSNQMLSFQTKPAPARIGFPQRPMQRMNEFEYFATEVGPVRAGYFCIQQKGMLVAFDTGTGKERWRRFDLPQQAECLGDEDNVVVIDRSQKRVQVLSALDGNELTVRSNFPLAKKFLRPSGLHYLIEPGTQEDDFSEDTTQSLPSESLTLEWINFASGATIWQRTWQEPAIPFEIDGRWLGVCTLSGKVELIELESGHVVKQHAVELPPEISKIACHAGDENILILISGKVTDENLIKATQQSQSYRRSLINGPVFCIDRMQGDLLWNQTLESALFPLDQPVDLPVFVTAENRFPEEAMDDQSPGSRIQLFDRRNGKRLYQSESLSSSSRFSVSGHLETGKVVLTTRESVVTFDFLMLDE